MIPDHAATLAIVLFALWVLYRWGALLFTLLAFVHGWLGEWDHAVLACVYAGFITLVCALASWRLDRVRRRDRRRGRFRSFPDA